MPQRRLGDIVRNQNLLHVHPETTVHAAAVQMTDRHVAAVLVLDDGALKGIFTERDLLQRVVAPGLDPDSTPIGQVMTPDPLSIDAGALGFEAVRLMREEGIRHMVVTGMPDSGFGYAIVSQRDFMGAEMADFERELEFENRLWEEI